MSKKLVALILAVTLILAAIPFMSIAEDTKPVTAPGLPANLVEGKVLYDLQDDLEKNPSGLPEGWIYGTGGVNTTQNLSFLWGKDSGAGTSAAVETYRDEPALKFATWDCEGILLAPAIETQNYVFEASFTIEKNNTYFGITSGSWGENYSDVASTVWLAVRGTDDPYIQGKGKNSTSKKSFSTFRPVTGDNAEEVALKLVSYNGTNYYYINGEYVTSTPWGYTDGSNTGGRLGLYSSGATGHVTSMTVKSIKTDIKVEVPSELAAKGVTLGDTLIQEDFESISAMPEGWQYGLGLGAFWGTAEDGGKVTDPYIKNGALYYNSSSCDALIGMPAISVADYVFEADLICAAKSGSFGLFNNMPSSITVGKDGGNACLSFVYINETEKSQITYYQRGQGQNQVYVDDTGFELLNDTTNNRIKLTIYCIDGINHYYVDGVLRATYKQNKPQGESSKVGFYTCQALFGIDNVVVKEVKVGLPDELTTQGVTVGESLLDYDFEDIDAIPEGFELRNPNWDGWPGNKGSMALSTATVNGKSDKGIQITPQADEVLLLPTLSTNNYVYEAEITVTSGASGSYGILNDMSTLVRADGADSKGNTGDYGCNRMVIYTMAHSDKAYVYYYTKFEGYKQKNLTKPAVFSALPVSGTTLNFKVYSFEGVNYFYIDNVFIKAFKNVKNFGPENVIGLFTSSAPVFISDISVKALNKTVDEANGNYYAIGDTIYTTDFEDETIGAIPEGWSSAYPGGSEDKGTKTSYGWTGNGGSASFVVEEIANHGKVYRLKATSSDLYTTAPSAKSLNYIYETNILINYNGQSFGPANNYYAPANKATGCVQSSVYVNNPTGKELYKYKGTGGRGDGTWIKEYNPQKGDIVNLKIVALNGNNYVYYNGVLSCVMPFRSAANVTEDYPGVYISGCDVYVLDASITSITPISAKVELAGAEATVNEEVVDLTFFAAFDKTQSSYTDNLEGDYEYSDDAKVKFGIVMAEGTDVFPFTAGAVVAFAKEVEQDETSLTFDLSFSVAKDKLDTEYTFRPFAEVNGVYYYGESIVQTAREFFSGDMNADEKINVVDLVAVANLVIGSAYDSRADIDVNGVVDTADLKAYRLAIIG